MRKAVNALKLAPLFSPLPLISLKCDTNNENLKEAA